MHIRVLSLESALAFSCLVHHRERCKHASRPSGLFALSASVWGHCSTSENNMNALLLRPTATFCRSAGPTHTFSKNATAFSAACRSRHVCPRSRARLQCRAALSNRSLLYLSGGGRLGDESVLSTSAHCLQVVMSHSPCTLQPRQTNQLMRLLMP